MNRYNLDRGDLIMAMRSMLVHFFSVCLLWCCLVLSSTAFGAYPSIVNFDLTQSENANVELSWTINGQSVYNYGVGFKDFDGDGKGDVSINAGLYFPVAETRSCSDYYVVPSSQFSVKNLTDADVEKFVKISNIDQLDSNRESIEYVDSCYSSDVQTIDDINGDGVGEFLVSYYSYDDFSSDYSFAFYSAILFGSKEPGYSVDFSNPISKELGIVFPKNYSVMVLQDMNGDAINEWATIHYEGNDNEVDSVFMSIHAGRSNWSDINSAEGDFYDVEMALVENILISNLTLMGDVNGDGLADLALLLVGTNDDELQSGWQIIYGSENLSVSAGFESSALTLCPSSDCSFQSLGDFNGDQFNDLLVAEEVGDTSNAYIVYGSAEGLPTALVDNNHTRLANIDVYFNKQNLYAYDALFSIDGKVGDINGDGKSDVLIENNGTTGFVLFGQEARPSQIDVTSLNGENGFLVFRSNDSYGETRVSDEDFDGFSDIVDVSNQVLLKGGSNAHALPGPSKVVLAVAFNGAYVTWEPKAGSLDTTLNISVDGHTVAEVSASQGYYQLIDQAIQRDSIVSLTFIDEQDQSSATVRLPYGTGVTGVFGFRAEVYSDNALELFWSSLPTTFNIWRNNQLIATTEGNSYVDDTVEPNVEYTYRVTETATSNQIAVLGDFDSLYAYSGCEQNYTFIDRGPIRMQVVPASTDNLSVITGMAQRSFQANDTIENQACYLNNIPTPYILDAAVYSETTLELFWERVSHDAIVEYAVFRNEELLTTTDGTSFLDTTIAAGDEYEYTVIARDTESGAQSEPAYYYQYTELGSGDFLDLDQAPENLTAQVYSSTALELFWDRSYYSDEGITYEIYRDGLLLESTSGTSFFDSSLAPGQSYDYDVLGYSHGFYSLPVSISLQTNSEYGSGSDQGSGSDTDDVTFSLDVNNLVGLVYSSNALEIFWDRANQNNGPISYSVYRNNALVGSTDGNSFFDSGLEPSTLYDYQVVPISLDNIQGSSAVISLTTNP